MPLADTAASALAALLASAAGARGLGALSLSGFAPALALLPPPAARDLSRALLASVASAGIRIDSALTAARLFSALSPVIRDAAVDVSAAEKLTSVVALIGAGAGGPLATAKEDIASLVVARAALAGGGTKGVAATFPTLCASLLDVATRAGSTAGGSASDNAASGIAREAHEALHETASALAVAGHAAAAIRAFSEAGKEATTPTATAQEYFSQGEERVCAHTSFLSSARPNN